MLGVAETILACPFWQLASCLVPALAVDGAVLVTDVPGIRPAREAALRSLYDCAQSGHSRGVVEVKMLDGTRRVTAAARTLRGVSAPMDHCDGLHEATEPLRAAVDLTTQRVLKALEPLVQFPGKVLPKDGGEWYETLADVTHAGEQLEHFHAYLPNSTTHHAPSSPAQPAAQALPLHTDAGMFIAMVPALYARGAPGSTQSIPSSTAEAAGGGLFIELSDGSLATVPAHLEQTSVLYALGDGWAEWINPSTRAKLRAAPHLMAMPRASAFTGAAATADGRSDDKAAQAAATVPHARLWYGRMFLPPSDALLPPHGVRFDAHRAAEQRAVGVRGAAAEANALVTDAALASDDYTLPTGCARGRRYLASTDECGNNQILCWLQCMSVADLPCGKDAVRPRANRTAPTVHTPSQSQASRCGAARFARHQLNTGGCRAARQQCRTDNGQGDVFAHTGSDDHCTTCAPGCEPSNVTVPVSQSEPFCYGKGTAMHMAGFVSATDSSCVILLSPDWVLNTEVMAHVVVVMVTNEQHMHVHNMHMHMPHATCHMPHATGHRPQATGHRPHATCHMPRATCHVPHATCRVPRHATCHVPRATPRHATPRHARPCHATPHHATCHAMPCHTHVHVCAQMRAGHFRAGTHQV